MTTTECRGKKLMDAVDEPILAQVRFSRRKRTSKGFADPNGLMRLLQEADCCKGGVDLLSI